jgi:hypothetical protein
MAACPRYTEPLLRNENIGDSLITINNNFNNLKQVICDLQNLIRNTVSVRTFFYYGPNALTDPTDGMQNSVTSRPSNSYIENFVNSSSQLNVPAISKVNDQAYVIYQKTGFYSQLATRRVNQTITVTPPAEFTWNEPPQQIPLTTTTPDQYAISVPMFFIWKLTARLINSNLRYITDLGFPKFTRSLTPSSPNWNQPQTWNQYTN